MDKDHVEDNKSNVQKETVDIEKNSEKNNKNYDYLEPGDTYSFEVGM